MKHSLLVIGLSVLVVSNAIAETSAPGMETLLFQEVVTVASQEAETLLEAPVITNVITEKDIRRMGARTLNDVLLTLPGFSHIQDHNEYFSAARGIYASAQQKILVLRDGHRLNSRSYSEANFDYSISLDNVKRIEILRGPGGSLYGDVALTGVVNIITKDANEVNGVEMIAGYGSYDQVKAGMVLGQKIGDQESLLLSGTFFKTSGQKADFIDPRTGAVGPGILYGFDNQPSYDTYLKYQVGNLVAAASRRYSHYVEPRTGSGITGQIYDVDQSDWFSGETPGLSSLFDHVELSYAPEWAGWKMVGKLYYDDFALRANLGINALTGTQGDLFWQDWNAGAQVQGTRGYDLEKLGKGSVLIGAQFETMEVFESTFKNGIPPAINQANPALKTGKERAYAGFAQVKHYLMENLIANLGLRYDYKERRPDTQVVNVDQFSPRGALIYLLAPELNFRLSYGHSFVDAPYWYRYNTLPSYQGALTLKPEKLDSYQFSVESLLISAVEQRLNVYYNDMSDVVFRNLSGSYTNAGTLKSGGIEYEVGYKQEDLSAKANYTFQRFYDVSGYSASDFKLENIPAHSVNVMLDYAPLSFLQADWAKNLWLNATLRHTSQQYARWGKALTNPQTLVDDALIVNLGITEVLLVGDRRSIILGIHAYNLFDRQYYQGGSVEYPFLQPGRWVLGEVTYAF